MNFSKLWNFVGLFKKISYSQIVDAKQKISIRLKTCKCAINKIPLNTFWYQPSESSNIREFMWLIMSFSMEENIRIS